MVDYEEPATDRRWCKARRVEVTEYLRREGVKHGRVGEWPAWHVTPHVSVWAIESLKRPGWIGWWVICGDLPTDYVSAAKIKHPREAIRAFGKDWREQARLMKSRKRPADVRLGSPEDWTSLAPLLEARASLLLEFAGDDSIWKDVEAR